MGGELWVDWIHEHGVERHAVPLPGHVRRCLTERNAQLLQHLLLLSRLLAAHVGVEAQELLVGIGARGGGLTADLQADEEHESTHAQYALSMHSLCLLADVYHSSRSDIGIVFQNYSLP